MPKSRELKRYKKLTRRSISFVVSFFPLDETGNAVRVNVRRGDADSVLNYFRQNRNISYFARLCEFLFPNCVLSDFNLNPRWLIPLRRKQTGGAFRAKGNIFSAITSIIWEAKVPLAQPGLYDSIRAAYNHCTNLHETVCVCVCTHRMYVCARECVSMPLNLNN